MFEQANRDQAGRLGLDPSSVPGGIYHLLTSVVLPRPIAWVSTRSISGVDNLAPHSFFTVASADPPIVQFTSVGTKDSLRNVVATGEFVVSICTESLVQQVNATAVPFSSDVSEFDAAGLTREASTVVAAARVAESPVSLECRLVDTKSFGASVVVFGQVVWVAVRPEVLREGRVDVTLLAPISRLGGSAYAPVRDVIDVPRLTVEEWQARTASAVDR